MFRPWFLVFLKTIIFDRVQISKTLTLWNRRDTNVTLRLLKNSGPSITFLRLSSESDWDHIIYQDSKLLAQVVYFAEADWTTLGCQINESTWLAFTHFFHPTRLANFHPTCLLGTLFWNSTNSKPTRHLLGPTCLRNLHKISTLLV